jgi:hypothetical protein
MLVFGAPLWYTMKEQRTGSKIPFVAERLMEILEAKHSTLPFVNLPTILVWEVGLFRLCGSEDIIFSLRNQIFVDLSDFPEEALVSSEPHVLAALLKRFFRELPDHIIGYVHYLRSYSRS